MYLHIGNGSSLRKRDIIGIFDLDALTTCAGGRKYLSVMSARGLAIYEDADLPRSVVLCNDGSDGYYGYSLRKIRGRVERRKYLRDRNRYRLRLSRISSVGLKSR